mmetsp:Transcript_75050/g.237281  ORF Transcript_75050/g.237281 Transcript_75050/m.237281 type:complete len:212 (+) Transcript_75050:436-1071(+)
MAASSSFEGPLFFFCVIMEPIMVEPSFSSAWAISVPVGSRAAWLGVNARTFPPYVVSTTSLCSPPVTLPESMHWMLSCRQVSKVSVGGTCSSRAVVGTAAVSPRLQTSKFPSSRPTRTSNTPLFTTSAVRSEQTLARRVPAVPDMPGRVCRSVMPPILRIVRESTCARPTMPCSVPYMMMTGSPDLLSGFSTLSLSKKPRAVPGPSTENSW